VISVPGALGVLAAYTANRFRWIGPSNLSHMLLNLVGAGVLTAVVERQWDSCSWKACGPWSTTERPNHADGSDNIT
jgi:hypothetical protein